MLTVLSAILPVFLVAGAGFAVCRVQALDSRTLTTLNLYLFVPCLIYDSLSRIELRWDVFARYALACTVMLLVMRVLLGGIARRRGLTGDARNALLLTMFMNLGNFGLPVCKFAFGDEGLALAVVVMVCGSFHQNSLAIYIAQRGKMTAKRSLGHVFRFPLIYAFVLALVAQRTGWHAPDILARSVSIAAGAAIPVQLIILGIQLAETRLDTSVDIGLASAVRLVVGPVLAIAVAALVGLEGLQAKVFILQMSGPVAVGVAAYGVQFNVAPRFLASAVAVTFLLSLVSVSVVLYLLM